MDFQLLLGQVSHRVGLGELVPPAAHDGTELLGIHGKDPFPVVSVVPDALLEKLGSGHGGHPASLGGLDVLSVVAGGHQFGAPRPAGDFPDKYTLDHLRVPHRHRQGSARTGGPSGQVSRGSAQVFQQSRHLLSPKVLLGKLAADHHVGLAAVAAVVDDDMAMGRQQGSHGTQAVVVHPSARRQHDRGAGAVLLVIQVDSVYVGVRHCSLLSV